MEDYAYLPLHLFLVRSGYINIISDIVLEDNEGIHIDTTISFQKIA